jgi:hypothetical protein
MRVLGIVTENRGNLRTTMVVPHLLGLMSRLLIRGVLVNENADPSGGPVFDFGKAGSYNAAGHEG